MEAAAAGLQEAAPLTLGLGSPCRKFEFNPKLGIDNPVLSLAEDHGPSDAWLCPERPRFCLLSKEEGGSFGFQLRQEAGGAGPAVCGVEPGAPAQRQGLREGDRILAVNDQAVAHEALEMVARRIRASGPRVLLAVAAAPAHDPALLCAPLGPGVRPRLCHVVRDEGGFGFSVTHEHPGSFWLVLSPGGAAERAGVPPGARLLEVNGLSVEQLTHSQLRRRLRRSGAQVTLLVAAPEVEEQCRRLGVPLAAPLAEGWALPAGPRRLHLQEGPRGFGFLLREEKGVGGRLGAPVPSPLPGGCGDRGPARRGRSPASRPAWLPPGLPPVQLVPRARRRLRLPPQLPGRRAPPLHRAGDARGRGGPGGAAAGRRDPGGERAPCGRRAGRGPAAPAGRGRAPSVPAAGGPVSAGLERAVAADLPDCPPSARQVAAPPELWTLETGALGAGQSQAAQRPSSPERGCLEASGGPAALPSASRGSHVGGLDASPAGSCLPEWRDFGFVIKIHMWSSPWHRAPTTQ
ncbi:Na(+)/H(+) exchange regulatory cofactor NHE-RF4 isoform X1 [Pipistrellus kuhlii]|uniref:Na(+)/H(+) exchange regulatory cofactor NHE-RF4 isoform X1 n=1 Tax=Pipistrellus kuhlii TaxID=59472 RepID=UPI001E26EA8F|nr:Na(+)/H(+) exchange regulatory cofactor NHE-RF4 isoform X1 [Pipistrellus kuhlii]